MRKTYITSMPDKVGAFLQATRAISACGGNITRVSYNRSIDSHLLFIEVEATAAVLDGITESLGKIGYLLQNMGGKKPMLISIHLADKPGTLLPVLEVIDGYRLNISYMSSEADGSGWQDYKLAMSVDDPGITRRLLEDISRLCEVTVTDYDPTEKLLDNTVFYLSFSQEMKRMLGLNEAQTQEFIVNSNIIMQMLDERGEAPYKTFEYVRRFAAAVAEHKEENWQARVSHRQLTDNISFHLIEPPCGSNTFVLDSGEELVLIDGGYPCYRPELTALLTSIIPDYASRKKTMVLTHADVDHAGIADTCDRILCSESCRINYQMELDGEDDFREQNRKDAPYSRLSKLITGYDAPPEISKIEVIGEKTDSAPYSRIAEIALLGLVFEVWEGNGGHVRGECVYLCREHKIAFTGDDLVNIHGFTPEQAAFNRLAPYLMSSVNVDSKKATVLRHILEKELDGWLVCPGHGQWFLQQSGGIKQ